DTAYCRSWGCMNAPTPNSNPTSNLPCRACGTVIAEPFLAVEDVRVWRCPACSLTQRTLVDPPAGAPMPPPWRERVLSR
ncbi:MAG TPA: hypothetical protein VEC60_15705, partial [Reyranella sp.]|nr:hypothetical protein [Reyranella sp.]